MPWLASVISGKRSEDRDLAMMEIHPFTLAFTGKCAAIEAPFKEDYVRRSLTQIRLVFLLSAIFIALFAILDAILAPALKHQLWFVRFGIICPYFIALFTFSFSRWFRTYMQPAVAASGLISGLGFVYMTVIGNALVASTYYAGVMLVVMLTSCLFWIRFIWSATCGWIIVTSYVVAAILNRHLPPESMVNNAFFCISANIFGMVVGYAFEYYNRRDFYMRDLLKSQHQEVEAARDALEERVNERTLMLAKANEELRNEIEAHQRLDWEKQVLEGQLRQAQKMEAIGTLAGGIAHDFNNILAAIMGHTELAFMEITNRKEAENCLSEVLSASHRARELVGQILAFSRQSESELKPLQISLVIQEAMRLLKATLPSSISIQQHIQAPESLVVADATQIHQIVINLCTNAAHAMESEGGTLTVSLEDQNVSQGNAGEPSTNPTQLADGDYVCLTIADTGHGIPGHIAERIFDPYFTTKDKGVGTGLGLAVVRGIVQNHGGLIQVQSQPGQGTRFKVYLPRSQGIGTQESQQFQILRQGSERILLVDDEEGLAELGAKLLTTLGYRVVAYTQPEKALAAVRDDVRAFDLVITDMIMPGMSGKDLAGKIIALRPDMPIIVYTGYTDLVAAETIRQMGVKAVLRKPITIHGLSQAIQKVLRQRPVEPGRTG